METTRRKIPDVPEPDHLGDYIIYDQIDMQNIAPMKDYLFEIGFEDHPPFFYRQ